MLAPRIGEAIHPAWDRTAALAMKLQPAMDRAGELSREAILVGSFALRLSAFGALAISVWRMGIDLGWTRDFFISQGLFSHWQVWLALALAMHSGAGFLARRSGIESDSDD